MVSQLFVFARHSVSMTDLPIAARNCGRSRCIALVRGPDCMRAWKSHPRTLRCPDPFHAPLCAGGDGFSRSARLDEGTEVRQEHHKPRRHQANFSSTRDDCLPSSVAENLQLNRARTVLVSNGFKGTSTEWSSDFRLPAFRSRASQANAACNFRPGKLKLTIAFVSNPAPS